MRKGRLTICIDARMGDTAGGIQQVAIGLAAGLSSLQDGDERYFFLTRSDGASWLRPYVAGPCEIVAAQAEPERTARSGARRLLALPLLEYLWRENAFVVRATLPEPARSDGSVERLGAQVVHFLSQTAFTTEVPSIYHPHDLQHLHLPRMFQTRARLVREKLYRYHCERARAVAVASSWVKEDVLRHYRVPPEKVFVVPLAPPTDAYPVPNAGDLAAAQARFSLPDRFVLYPAQTWPHKNHLALIAAIERLASEGLRIPLVCSGHRNDHYATIAAAIQKAKLGGLVHFVGFVTPLELQCLYRRCDGVVIPSLFEAASFPLWEAMHAGAPCACSNVTSLPKQAGDAALVFDARDIGAMAAALAKLWSDARLRDELRRRGRARVAQFTWRATALHFRALYRFLAGTATDHDSALLKAAPLL